MNRHFINYINGAKVKSVQKTCVANTLSCIIITLVDINSTEKVVVVADRALISYDNGFYFHINKGDEIDTLILSLISDF